MNKLFNLSLIELLKHHISSRLLILGINQISNILIYSYLIYLFGLDKFGQFTTGLIYAQVSIVFLEWGFQTHATESFQNKKNSYTFNYFISSTILKIISLILFFLIFLFCQIYYRINFNIDSTILIFLIIIFGSLNPLWFLNIYKISRLLIYPTIIGKFIYIFFVIFFFSSDTNFILVYCLISITYLINTSVGYYIIFIKFYSKYNFSFQKLFTILKNSFSYFLASIINHNITSLWALYIVLSSSNTTIALFSFSEQIYRGMCLVINLIANALRIELMSNKIKFIKFIIRRIVITLILFSFIILSLAYLYNLAFDLNTEYFYIGFLFMISWTFFSISKLVSIPLLGHLINMTKINFYVLVYGFINMIIILSCSTLNISNLLNIISLIMFISIFDCLYYITRTWYNLKLIDEK